MKNFIGLRDLASMESGVIEKKRKDFFAAKGFLTEDGGKESVGVGWTDSRERGDLLCG